MAETVTRSVLLYRTRFDATSVAVGVVKWGPGGLRN